MKICVIIPVYNHGDTLAATLAGLRRFGLPTYIVDDGSDAHTRALIDNVAAEFDITRITLPHNQGKGAAVIEGFRAAWDDGFSHAVQVDADGQHDIDDLGRLLNEAREHPDALVSGNPQFDDSVPPGRLYGRKITRFWVWIETLSLSIPDAMCGFRVYPLEPCIRLVEDRRLGPRMEFDIEIAVRLYWRGVPFIAIPSRVIYPEHGTSHFRMLRDNARISWTHTRLFFGMLLRAPLLILRKFGVRRRHWSRLEERSTVLGMKLLLASYRLFGRGVFRVLLFPVIGYYYLTSTTARRASRQFLDRVEATRRRRDGVVADELSGFRHFLQFGEAILDKAAQWGEIRSSDNIRYVAPEAYEEIVGRQRGGVFIGSHLGNLEALRAFGDLEQDITVNALVFTRHSPKFMRFLEQANPEAVAHIVQVDTLGPESVVRMQKRIEAREWIALVADRTSISESGRTVPCEFLGDTAHFPEGPFVLAALLECPVYFLFCLKQDGVYNVYLDKLAERLDLPRGERAEKIQAAVSRYAARLEQLCLEFPYQWYNFFDFWQEPHGK